MTFYSPMPRVWPIVAALLFALTACESSDTTQDDTIPTSACASVECADDQTCDEATGECISTAEPECVSDSDCNDSTLACIEGVCVSKCEGVTCPDGQVCDPTSGGCLQDYSCSSDGDCPDGMTCGSNGVCGLPARSDCTGGLPCAEGLTCVNGPVSLCVPPCESNNDCGTIDFCVTSENVPIAPFAGYIGYCLVNGCQPGGDGFGFAQDAPNFGPCSDRAGNPEGGVCLPDAFTGLGLGICFAADGPAGNGEACDPFANWGSDQVCSPGLFCNPLLFDGTCSQLCNVYDDETCEQTDYFNGLNDNACLPVVGGDGICIPSLGGADGGETCTPSPDAQLALCQDNYGCGPSNLDRTEFSCNPWCDPATDGVSATYCGEGEYCWTETDEAAAGVCAPSACKSEVQCGEGEICDNDSGGCIDILES
ncbi:MAG: hypothetical protein VX834_10915, partial [Myxococcota bacterium]|nr:hypothetical protein [Myxococcota bacterium]